MNNRPAEGISTWDVISLDPLMGLHLILPLILLIPAYYGFSTFEENLSALAKILGVNLNAFYIFFAVPTAIEQMQSFYRVSMRPGDSPSLLQLVVSAPAIFWLCLGILEINPVTQASTLLKIDPTFIYLLMAFIPLYPVIID